LLVGHSLASRRNNKVAPCRGIVVVVVAIIVVAIVVVVVVPTPAVAGRGVVGIITIS
jgi:t-SNARE complex subunit (syntaxin)